MKLSPSLLGAALALVVVHSATVRAQSPSPVPETGAVQDARPVEDAHKIPVQKKPANSLPTIYLIGDSTVRVGTPNEKGWGDELAPYFDLAKINVVNDAIGGRSSRTFQTEGRWASVVDALQKGDFVIMQFGHNDPGAVNDNSRARGSIRGTGTDTQEIDNMLTHQHEVVHTFGWYMQKYINDTKAKGATPIVCSPIPHKIWKDNKIERAASSYGGWAREEASKNGALFVDLNEIIASGYDKMGPEKVEPMFGDPHTHTTQAGAAYNAWCVTGGLRGLPGAPLDQYLSDSGKAVGAVSSEAK